MILDSLAHASNYVHLHPLFPAAFEYLRSFDPGTPKGRYELDGNRLYVLIQHFDTAPEETRSWEAHRNYANIQYGVSGREKILHSPVADLTPIGPYNPEKDVEKFTGESAPNVSPLIVPPGSFVVFFPQDGHKACCAVDGPEPIVKAVLKVRLIG